MLVLKAVTAVVAGVLTAMAVSQVLGQLEAARARVRARNPQQPKPVTRLRQDPRTGIYYPEA